MSGKSKFQPPNIEKIEDIPDIKMSTHPNFKNLTGERFDRLTVIKYAGQLDNNCKEGFWWCECSCENRTLIAVRVGALKIGNTKSCGCLSSEITRNRNTKHGMKFTSEHTVWMNIKSRCYNTNNKAYKNYGGRGITMCERWLESFENFYEDMGDRPSPKHSIDRIDNDGDYCPENCKWSTKQEQNRNKRNNLYLEYNKERLIAKDWCEKIDIDYDTLRARIRSGLSDEQCLTNPVQNTKPKNK